MNDFYVGYLPSAPPGIRRRARMTVLFAVLLAIAGAALFAASQRQFANSFFEYGKPTEFAGTLNLQPFPTLVVENPDAASAKSEAPYLLVAPGKFGADSLLAGIDGKRVRLRGTLIHRGEEHMIEIEPGSVSTVQGSSVRSGLQVQDLGLVTLSGEIVDTKCYLGVMNPGEGKVHRDCAARCLSGGIPPALVTSDFGGTSLLFLLLGEDGRPLAKPDFLQRIGQPVSIQGQAFASRGLYYLRTNTSGIQPLP
jgi:hypothetical protein